MASSTLTSLQNPEIRQAYIDGGVALVRAAADSYKNIRDKNADSPAAYLILNGVVEGLEEIIKSWPAMVDVVADSAERMAQK